MLLWFLPFASASGGAPVPPAATTFFQLGPLPVTSSMIAVWIVAGLIMAILALGTRRMSLVPTGAQNLVEATVEAV